MSTLAWMACERNNATMRDIIHQRTENRKLLLPDVAHPTSSSANLKRRLPSGLYGGGPTGHFRNPNAHNEDPVAVF